MFKSVKKIVIMGLCMLMLSVVSVSAGYVTCQQESATRFGRYEANCYGNYISLHGYYDSTSEKYTVMNYMGPEGKPTKHYSGCHAGKRNADLAVNVKRSFKSYAHTHSFTENMD